MPHEFNRTATSHSFIRSGQQPSAMKQTQVVHNCYDYSPDQQTIPNPVSDNLVFLAGGPEVASVVSMMLRLTAMYRSTASSARKMLLRGCAVLI